MLTEGVTGGVPRFDFRKGIKVKGGNVKGGMEHMNTSSLVTKMKEK